MTGDKLVAIGWVFAAILVSGLSMIFAGKLLHVSLALIHKLLAVICLVLLPRIGNLLRPFTQHPLFQSRSLSSRSLTLQPS